MSAARNEPSAISELPTPPAAISSAPTASVAISAAPMASVAMSAAVNVSGATLADVTALSARSSVMMEPFTIFDESTESGPRSERVTMLPGATRLQLLPLER